MLYGAGHNSPPRQRSRAIRVALGTHQGKADLAAARHRCVSIFRKCLWAKENIGTSSVWPMRLVREMASRLTVEFGHRVVAAAASE